MICYPLTAMSGHVTKKSKTLFCRAFNCGSSALHFRSLCQRVRSLAPKYKKNRWNLLLAAVTVDLASSYWWNRRRSAVFNRYIFVFLPHFLIGRIWAASIDEIDDTERINPMERSTQCIGVLCQEIDVGENGNWSKLGRHIFQFSMSWKMILTSWRHFRDQFLIG